jgi:hypothetical protein
MPVPAGTNSGAVTRSRFSSNARLVWKNSLMSRMAHSVSRGVSRDAYAGGTTMELVMVLLGELWSMR